jgi:hypothetical protein
LRWLGWLNVVGIFVVSIGKGDTEMGKSATKAIVMLLSGNFFTKKVVDGGGGGDLKCCGAAQPGFLLGPLDQKSWLRL